MSQTFTIAALAEALGVPFEGDGAYVVARLAHPADKLVAQDLVLAMDPALEPLLATSAAKAVVLSGEKRAIPANIAAALFVPRGRLAMAQLTKLFFKPLPVAQGIHPTAVIEPGVELGANVSIGAHVTITSGAVIGARTVLHPGVYIGPDVHLGEDSLLYAGVKIGARVRIGARAVIHFNASIGADGFSFVTPEVGSVESAHATGSIGATNAQLVRIYSLGSVVLGDDVEVGANTSIDQGTIVPTQVGSGTKIDNQVQVGHNVQIGEGCLICGRVGIAGSAVVGNHVVLGGAVGVADHVKIGDDTIVMAMSGVSGNIAPKSLVLGVPAKPRASFIRQMFNISRIGKMADKIAALEARLAALEGK